VFSRPITSIGGRSHFIGRFGLIDCADRASIDVHTTAAWYRQRVRRLRWRLRRRRVCVDVPSNWLCGMVVLTMIVRRAATPPASAGMHAEHEEQQCTEEDHATVALKKRSHSDTLMLN
jgi:hypothetical protein